MKTIIHSTNDALAYLLQGLFATEKMLKETLPGCFTAITSARISDAFNDYVDSSTNKLLKLERAFNYLMTDQMTRKNEALHQLMVEMHHILPATTSQHLRNILGIGYLQSINTYKISCYRSAYLFAVEMELDTVTDLLQQILEWEIDSSKALAQLALEEFNKQQPELKS
jgi:ferritin-like metal-binding protein YciE